MRINEALDLFTVQLEADGRSAHTIRQYQRHVALFETWLGEAREIENLDHTVVARFLASDAVRRRADGERRKATSANAIRSSMRRFLGYLHEAGLVRENPGRLVRRANTGAPPPRGLTDAEVKRLLAVLDQANGDAAERDRMLVRLMLGTGIRLSSALAIAVENLDLDEGTILLRATKGDRTQTVFLNPDLRVAIAAYIGERTSGPLFPGRDEGRITSRHAQRRFRAWRDRAGIASAVSPHSCRHTCAERLYLSTGDILIVREALGHASLASTLVYARAGERRLRAAMSAGS